jgi:hypothetical protein
MASWANAFQGAYTHLPSGGGQSIFGAGLQEGQERLRRQGDQAHSMDMLNAQQRPEMMRLDQSQNRWNALFPYLTGALGGASRVGGKSTPGPRINAGPIWNQGSMQQNVNAMRGQGAQETASGVEQMRNRLAGSGYGSNSPLASALETQMGMGNNANVANQVREFRQNAAQQNAQQIYRGQTAQEQQHANRMQEDIERRRMVSGYQTGLYGMLSGMM